jgi:3-deoxy-D-manno-octulosonic-acid transferase
MALSGFQKLWLVFYRALMAFLYGIARLGSFFYRDSSFEERLGIYREEDRQKISVGYNLWLHAASAGEVNAITPFCLALRKAKPEARIVLTTTSKTGKKIALETGVADAVFLAPLDSGPSLRKAFQVIRPVLVLVAETEFWPNWLLRTAQNGISVLLINGRISDRSFPSYQRLKPLFSPALNCFSACLVQTQGDLEKLATLGVSQKRVEVVGQMKYDLSIPDASKVETFKGTLGYGKDDVLFTLGSLREGEDDLLLPLVPEILRLSPKVRVLIAPRHLKNARLFQEKLGKFGVPSVLRSSLAKSPGSERVVVLDTLGELSLAYALSRAAFVGGTLVPVGGHNVMEPALSSVPVCFGPYTQNVAEATEALVQSAGGFLVEDAAQIPRLFEKLMDDGFSKEAGRKAYQAVAAMRGATEKTIEKVLAKWPINP